METMVRLNDVPFKELKETIPILDKAGWTADDLALLRKPGVAGRLVQHVREQYFFPNEVAASDLGYPSAWKDIDALDQQVYKLHQRWPHLDCSHLEETLAWLICGGIREDIRRGDIDGYLAVPKPSAIVPHDEQSGDIIQLYQHALRRLLSMVRGACPRWLVGIPEMWSVAFHPRTRRFFERDHLFKGDVMLIPVQTGMRHRGASPRRACGTMHPQEFPLDFYSSLVLLWSHPYRFPPSQPALGFHCPGSLYETNQPAHQWVVPSWKSIDAGTSLEAVGWTTKHADRGVASGFANESFFTE